MDTFLSTLTQTTAALIAILLAAVTAYYVFLQSKAAEYDDRIQAEQTGIREEIAGLQARWQPGLVWYLPPEFKESFSKRNGNVYGTQLVNQLATAVIFPTPQTLSALEDVKPHDTFGTAHWQGRVYFLALDESLKVISGGAALAHTGFTLGQPEPKLHPDAAFPSSPVGPGFREWRNDFEQISTADRFLEGQTGLAIADFQAFLKSHPQIGDAPWLDLYRTCVTSFHATIAGIRIRVRNVDGLQLVRSRYSFYTRVHWVALLLLIATSSAVGVALPLFVMAVLGSRITSAAATAILVASLALVIGSFIQFGLDVFKPLAEDPQLYIADRWLRPIAEDIGKYPTWLDSGSTVAVERLTQFLRSGSTRKLPPDLIESLESCQVAASDYNTSAEALDRAVLGRMQSDEKLQPFRRPYLEAGRRAHPLLRPSDVVSSAKMQELQKGLGNSGEILIGVETSTWWGSRGRLALFATPRKRDELLQALEELNGSLRSSPEAQQFSKQKEIVSKSASRLIEKLNKFLKGQVPPS